MPDYRLKFDAAPGQELDAFALLACQEYNLGNTGEWFGHFRGGYYGHCSRLNGVAIHYAQMHEWGPTPKVWLIEYDLASFFFNADSALECFVYALNAFGNAVAPSLFREVTNPTKLKQIGVRDLGLGSRKPLDGYEKYFPNVYREWIANASLLNRIIELHDVSKHRKTIYIGGDHRVDAPLGFYEAMGVTDDVRKSLFWPAKETLLPFDPKMLSGKPPPMDRKDYDTLEDLAPRFCDFINLIVKTAADDAKANIALNEYSLH